MIPLSGYYYHTRAVVCLVCGAAAAAFVRTVRLEIEVLGGAEERVVTPAEWAALGYYHARDCPSEVVANRF